MECIARYLRDTLEALAVMEVDKQCPRCKCWGLNVYKDKESKEIIFECAQCGYLRDMDGNGIKVKELVFASDEDLHSAGLV